MIIVRYQGPSGPAYGRLVDGIVYTLGTDDIFAVPPTGTAPGLNEANSSRYKRDLRRTAPGLNEANSSRYKRDLRGTALGPLETLALLPPACPSKIVAVGRNYAEHAREHGADVPSQPLIFLKAPSSVVGPGQAIQLPRLSQRVEHEAELAVVIGRRCKDVAEADAWQVILGVTCANDVTARDIQRSDGQWARGKSFDTFCPLGPHIVTHLAPHQLERLRVTCRVNGQVRQQGNTADMLFKIPHLIAYVTAVMTLLAGDVILSGTPAGVGPLRSGDVVEVDIEAIGLLRNPVE